MKKLWLALAFFFFALGAVGAFVPILPTVPFLLLASFFFLRGSEKHYRWFQGTKLYQTHLKDYADHRAMTLRTKLCILLPVSALLVLPMILVPNTAMRVTLCCVLVVKYYYFFRHIKTIPPGEKISPAANRDLEE